MRGNPLIDLTLKEIAKDYQPGTLPWMKANRPDEWGKMLTLEGRINGMALEGNLDGLRRTLEEYQSLMVEEFKAPKEKRGQKSLWSVP